MGEVFRARDTELRRDVAIKILPDLVASDPERLARFEREAQLVASLSHPNIAHVYGLERRRDDVGAVTPCLVMELVEGPSLAERVASGAIPVREALGLARQIADGLEAAHEKGIIHRDLKPANVKLTADGQVKILDFGLAKALDPAGSSSGRVSESPTLTARATQLGVILGTAAYMAPEQARGRAVDRRADIWAFGCVLYEMLTGRRAFEGEEMTSVLARVIERDPELGALPSDTPPAVRRLLARCFDKDPKARLRDIGEARVAVDAVLSGREAGAETSGPAIAVAATTQRGRRAVWPWAIAGVMGALAAAGWLLPRPTPSTAPDSRLRVELSLPADVEFFSTPRITSDDRRVAFIGVREGIRQLYVRTLSQSETKAVAGTEGATNLAFSPDGGSAAVLLTDGRLLRVAFDSGVVDDIGVTADILSAVEWMPTGELILSQVTRLVTVPAGGGPVRELVALDRDAGETSMIRPVLAGSFVLFTSWRSANNRAEPRIEAVPLSGGERRVVVEGGESVMAVTPDRLIYQREGALFVSAYDPGSAAVESAPVRITEEIQMNPSGMPAADLSATGTLIFAESRVFHGRLVWVSIDGVELAVDAPARPYQNPRVSPDGTKIAFSELGTIWTFDTTRRTFTRVYEGLNTLTGFPVWSADGARVFFRTADGIYSKRADGEGDLDLVAGTSRQDYPSSVSRDGATLAFLRITAEASGDILLAPLAGGELKVAVSTRSYEGGPQISPDGKWLAYVSNETGAWEVFLRSIEGPDGKWAVSSGGGLHPLWSPDGRTLHYRSGQRMFAVDVDTSPTVRLGTARVLFDRRYSFGPNLTVPNYSMSRDGRDLLLVREEGGGGHLSLVFNWLQTIGR